MKHALLALLLLGAISGCHRPQKYEATVEITRVAALRKDEQGKPLTTDVELSYIECPGTQIEVMRGDKDFSACVAEKVKVGDKVKVKIDHHYASGTYDYDVTEVAGCVRTPDPNDEASYKLVRDCADWTVNGARVGFKCAYSDKKELNKKCPWFYRH